MPDQKMTFDKGVRRSKSPLNLGKDELWLAEGLFYRFDDTDCLWKLRGRTTTGSLPASANAIDVEHLQFQGMTPSKLAALVDGIIREATSAHGALSWSTAQTNTSSPNNVALTGTTFMKGLSDGNNRWVLWDGEDIQPWLRDNSATGNWRRAGIGVPGALQPTLAKNTTAAVPQRATASGAGSWASPDNAWDSSTTTYSSTTVSTGTPGPITQLWTFLGAPSNTTSKSLYVKVATLALPPINPDTGGGGSGGHHGGSDTTSVGHLLIEWSEDSGATWNTLLSSNSPIATTTFSKAMLGGHNIANVQVRATLTNVSGSTSVSGLVYDIQIADTASASSSLVTSGTYTYLATVVYKGDDGITVEGEGSNYQGCSITITNPADTCYGVTLTFPDGFLEASGATEANGFKLANTYFRVYRTTSTGVYPNMTQVGELSAQTGSFTWVDNFAVAGTSSSGVPYPLLTSNGVSLPSNTILSPIYDACMYQSALVAIPATDRTRIQWSLPGSVEYFPVLHDVTITTDRLNDQLCGISTINSVMILFTRTQTQRIDGLIFAGQTTFDPANMRRETLSPSVGLAGSPRGYAQFLGPRGEPTIAWISDNGIYATDGRYPHERGTGVYRISDAVDWDELVDNSRLMESSLLYDPTQELLWFDFYGKDGLRKSLTFHVAPVHWYPFDQGHAVPKFTGPHLSGRGDGTRNIVSRTIGAPSGTFFQWSLTDDGHVWNEWSGVKDEALLYNPRGDMVARFQTGWQYPGGPRGFSHAYTGALAHDDWGPQAQADVLFEARDDDSGAIQFVRKDGVSLRGAKVTRFWLSRAGQSLRFTVQHVGQAYGSFTYLDIDLEASPGSEGV